MYRILRCSHDMVQENVRYLVFSWILESDIPDTVQTSYRIQIDRDGTFLDPDFDTGFVEDFASNRVPVPGFVSVPAVRYRYRIRSRNNHGEETAWSKTEWFENTAFAPSHWTARWITGDLKDSDAGISDAKLYRRELHLDGKIVSARLYATALGMYELWINGRRIGGDHLAPGWTEYGKRVVYRSHDVGRFLKEGDNCLGAVVGAGWYKGTMGYDHSRCNYGSHVAFFCQLDVRFADGSVQTVGSDESWYWSSGPIRFSEVYDGEIYDARLEQPGWSLPNFVFDNWHPVRTVPIPVSLLSPADAPPVVVSDALSVRRILHTKKGETVLDFGQNLAGVVWFEVFGKPGDCVELQHGEVLDGDGNFYSDNLRGARQTVRYICRGDKEGERYLPHFTYQGFRYVKIVRYPGPIVDERFRAFALCSAMREAGSFCCSEDLVNRLHHNIVWGLKSNFVDIPTDCPQRDERLGWTGDAQVFCPTACFLMDVHAFFRKWLVDLKLAQEPNGRVSHFVPNLKQSNIERTALDHSQSYAGWGDAATIIPWTLYVFYGDRDVLESHYASMKGWVDYVHGHATDGVLWESGLQLGDWLSLDGADGSLYGATPTALVATAYYARSTRIVAKVAKILGRWTDYAYYTALADAIILAFQKRYCADDGSLVVVTQSACALALCFHLVPEKSRSSVADQLVDALDQNGGHLTTGFLGTPHLCFALSENGRASKAYDLLLRRDCPSWLYQVERGATTVWEHWDGIKEDGTFWDASMNSFNHYAYGAIAQWLYQGMAGIVPDESYPGFRRFRVEPAIDGRLPSVAVSHDTPYGLIRVSWTMEGGKGEVHLLVPVNTVAEVRLTGMQRVDSSLLEPTGDGIFSGKVGSGAHVFPFSLPATV